jgi:hypothetical protein
MGDSPARAAPAARSPTYRRAAEAAYWLLPLALAALQLLFARQASGLLRYEEVAESIRNVYWLDHRLLYDGISSNVGWYGLLLAVYKLFGFTLFTGRWVRVALQLGSLLCLAWLLRRRLPPAAAAVPLLAIGLSPSLLFFNTVQTTFGTDLVLAPYALVPLALLGACCGAARRGPPLLLAALFGAIAMFAAMCYPVFLFYLPALALLFWWQANAAAGRGRWAWPAAPLVAAAAGGFLAPLAAAGAWLKEPRLLFFDPHTGSGLFRGGGGAFTADRGAILDNSRRALDDLFVEGRSYYFWLERPELSGWMAQVPFWLVVAGSGVLFARRPRSRPLLLLLWLLPLANLLLSSASLGPPGLRRATALLAGFYALFVLVWETLVRAGRHRRLAAAGMAICLLLPGHHLVAAKANYPHLTRAGAHQQQVWFRVAATPDQALAHWLDWTEHGRPLNCLEIGVYPRSCQYSGIYGALAGHRRWNGLPAVVVVGYDPWREVEVELRLALWDRHEFPH